MKHVIHIFGASGAGTSTLGRKICAEFGWFFMDTDDYFWLPAEPKYTVKRDPQERIAIMKRDILAHENVVISGSLVGWGDELIPLFTLAVFMVTDTEIRLERIKKRERQKFEDRILPGGDRYETYRAFLDWAGAYDTGGVEIRSKKMHDAWQTLLPCRQILLDGAEAPETNLLAVKRELQEMEQ